MGTGSEGAGEVLGGGCLLKCLAACGGVGFRSVGPPSGGWGVDARCRVGSL